MMPIKVQRKFLFLFLKKSELLLGIKEFEIKIKEKRIHIYSCGLLVLWICLLFCLINFFLRTKHLEEFIDVKILGS